MKYKGIIFDLDGVLCSTDRFHFEAWKQTAEEVGAPFDETINMKLRGVSRMESLEIILSGSSKTFTDAEKERLATEKNDRYRKLLAQMSPADMPTAVRDALTALHNAGLKLAVGSSSKNAAYILERLDANRYFDAVCDGTMIAHSKPDPEVFTKAAAMVGLAPTDCLVVEDAAAGLEAARAGGMNRRVLSHYDCMTVGENANVTPELACLYAGEDRHELNMVFQFELMDVDGGESRKWEPEHPWKLTDIKKIQTRWQTGLDGKAWNSLYWNNHDQPRVVSRFGCTKDEESRVRSAKMLAVCLYLMQGTPYIYQGEELGMTNKHFDSIDPINDVMTRNAYFEKTQRCGESVADFMKAANYISREHTRTPMHWDDTANAGFTTGTPWIPLNPNYPQINAAKQVGDPDSVYSFYRRLLALRKSDKTFVYGHYALLLPDDEEIYAYTRTLNDEQILVVCNFTDHDVPCPLLNDWQNTELLISNYNTPGNPGSLRPFEAVVYRK